MAQETLDDGNVIIELPECEINQIPFDELITIE